MPFNFNQIRVSPEIAATEKLLKAVLAKRLKLHPSEITSIRITKKSIDARQQKAKINLSGIVFLNEKDKGFTFDEPIYRDVSKAPEVHIIGAGPAGLFAALHCIEKGLKPVIVERGKDVRQRRRDLKAININHVVNEDSNYCFGEGGAGTYSDGKLYTRSKKRGDVKRVLELLVYFGANPNILVNAQPHIGTNKLPAIISDMREKIIACGGEVHFETKLSDLRIKDSKIEKVCLNDSLWINVNALILATGHSARDIYYLLQKHKIKIEAKPFALGVRVEHSQDLINRIQYKADYNNAFLPPAPYKIVQQVNGRGVYSFCMCPGGIIAPCATSPGEVVTNGWSPSKRDQPTSNSGIVVELKLEDLENASEDPLAGLKFQQSIEQKACKMAGNNQTVPAQRLVDFLEGRVSASIPKTSYKPGTYSMNLSDLFPGFISDALKQAFKSFDQKMKGFVSNEAILHAPESRTSSPVRIPRDRESLEHPQIESLYPCGEGAGYAGGIVSAAIDGMLCAEKVSVKFLNRS